MELKVIEGGLDLLDYNYIDGEITDTRLMGVLGLHLHWRAEGAISGEFDKHQFLYYDIEELGLDQLAVYEGNEPVGIEVAVKILFGGLGGRMVPVYEREARYLVNLFVEETRKKGEALPATADELRFILDKPVTLSEGEKYVLGKKMCVKLSTDYAACHYFLMRLMGHDPEGAQFVSSPSVAAQLRDEGKKSFGIAPPAPATFLRNRITSKHHKDGSAECLCESLIEAQDGYYMVFTGLEVKDELVQSAEFKDRFRITDFEASLQLRREEFITLYEITGDRSEFDLEFAVHSLGCTMSAHESGTMYMQFRPDNSHVEQKIFNLNDDVKAIYFVTESGQMLIAAYDQGDIGVAEHDVMKSLLREHILPVQKYLFRDSVIYDFARSGFDDFNEFVETIEE